MIRAFMVLIVCLTTTQVLAKKPKVFSEISFMKVLDTTCIGAKFNKELFSKYASTSFSFAKKLPEDLLGGMQYADIGYSIAISKQDFRDTGIAYIVTMGDRTNKGRVTTYCAITIGLDSGKLIEKLLKNRYSAKLIDETRQGLSSVSILSANLLGYTNKVIFSVQYSKEARTTILSMFQFKGV